MSDAVRAIPPADATRAVDVLALAFGSDPAARWTWPDPHGYLQHFPPFARAFGGAAFTSDSADQVGDGAGVALWLPPGVEPDEPALMAMIESTAPAHLLGDIEAVLGQMGGHHPAEPHWYLPMIGVDPARQGQGCGAALLRHALLRCDLHRLPAYLESSNPRNIPLYQRHGFEAIGVIQVGSSPTIVPMLRKPR